MPNYPSPLPGLTSLRKAFEFIKTVMKQVLGHGQAVLAQPCHRYRVPYLGVASPTVIPFNFSQPNTYLPQIFPLSHLQGFSCSSPFEKSRTQKALHYLLTTTTLSAPAYDPRP